MTDTRSLYLTTVYPLSIVYIHHQWLPFEIDLDKVTYDDTLSIQIVPAAYESVRYPPLLHEVRHFTQHRPIVPRVKFRTAYSCQFHETTGRRRKIEKPLPTAYQFAIVLTKPLSICILPATTPANGHQFTWWKILTGWGFGITIQHNLNLVIPQLCVGIPIADHSHKRGVVLVYPVTLNTRSSIHITDSSCVGSKCVDNSFDDITILLGGEIAFPFLFKGQDISHSLISPGFIQLYGLYLVIIREHRITFLALKAVHDHHQHLKERTDLQRVQLTGSI